MLAHRGIRSHLSDFGNAALGHVRLPIVGLDPTYDQPVITPDDRWAVAFVGEVLNFREVDPDLACDTPLVVKTWCDTGPAGFRQFDGFWSIAAIDRRRGYLHLLTDYLAQKPLYYRTDVVAAASEPRAIAELAPTTPDETYFAAVHKWGYSPDGRTPWTEVKKVPPGTHLVLDSSGAIVHQVVTDPIAPRSIRDDLTLFNALFLATARRVRADVPVAVLASGGLDSSIVLALLQDHVRPTVYHVDNGSVEHAWFEKLGLPAGRVRRVPVTGHDLRTRMLAYLQEPLDLGSLGPQTALADAIHHDDPGIRVVLTGDGADELFGGYDRAQRYDSQASDVWHELVHYHLPRLDRVMMRRQLEVRSPFLARSVVEIALGLPREKRRGKAILRDLFRAILPEGLADQPKRPLKAPAVAADRLGETSQLVQQFRSAA